MSNIDDLVISLTVSQDPELKKLKKLLEDFNKAIKTTGGATIPIGGGLDSTILSKLNKIEARMYYLLPTWHGEAQTKQVGMTLLNLLKEIGPEKMARGMLKSEKALTAFKKQFGVDDDDEIRKKLELYVEKWEDVLTHIAKGVFGGRAALSFTTEMKDLLSKRETAQAKTLFDKVEKFIPEALQQELFMQLIKDKLSDPNVFKELQYRPLPTKLPEEIQKNLLEQIAQKLSELDVDDLGLEEMLEEEDIPITKITMEYLKSAGVSLKEILADPEEIIKKDEVRYFMLKMLEKSLEGKESLALIDPMFKHLHKILDLEKVKDVFGNLAQITNAIDFVMEKTDLLKVLGETGQYNMEAIENVLADLNDVILVEFHDNLLNLDSERKHYTQLRDDMIILTNDMKHSSELIQEGIKVLPAPIISEGKLTDEARKNLSDLIEKESAKEEVEKLINSVDGLKTILGNIAPNVAKELKELLEKIKEMDLTGGP